MFQKRRQRRLSKFFGRFGFFVDTSDPGCGLLVRAMGAKILS
jgi:hypothetical protein